MSREKKGYALKRSLGLVPHNYDKNSRIFNLGAWKNWSRSEIYSERNQERASTYDNVMRGRD